MLDLNSYEMARYTLWMNQKIERSLPNRWNNKNITQFWKTITLFPFVYEQIRPMVSKHHCKCIINQHFYHFLTTLNYNVCNFSGWHTNYIKSKHNIIDQLQVAKWVPFSTMAVTAWLMIGQNIIFYILLCCSV